MKCRNRLEPGWRAVRSIPVVLAGLLVCGIAVPTAAQDEAELVAEQPEGVIDAASYSRLEILGLRGAVSVRAGRPGDLRYGCRDLKTRREDRPVALWIDGRALILGPAEGIEDERLLCEAVVPPNLSVIVELDDGKVVVNNLANDIEISGASLDVDARALTAGISVEIDRGKVQIRGAAGDVDITGKDVSLTAEDLGSFLALDLEGGKANVRDVTGDVNAELVNAVVAIEGVGGTTSVSAEGGEVVLSALQSGGDIVLSEARLVLAASNGPFEIDTDGDVELRDTQGDARVRADGGKIAALGCAGNLEIDAVEAEITVERVAGKTTILGDGLRLQLRDLGGELSVSTSGSQVVVAGVDGPAFVQNDFGDVVIAKASQSVNVKNSQGSVRITQLAGPVTIDSDGPDVTVHFVDTSHGQNSTVKNNGGNMTLMFSHKSGGRLEAKSTGGRVQGNLPGVDFDDDGKNARGTVNRMGRPTVKAVAGGDLFINAGPRVGGAGGRQKKSGKDTDTPPDG